MNQQAMRKEGILQPILPDPLPDTLPGETPVLGGWVAMELDGMSLGMLELGVMGCVVTIVGGSITSHTASFGPPQSCARS